MGHLIKVFFLFSVLLASSLFIRYLIPYAEYNHIKNAVFIYSKSSRKSEWVIITFKNVAGIKTSFIESHDAIWSLGMHRWIHPESRDLEEYFDRIGWLYSLIPQIVVQQKLVSSNRELYFQVEDWLKDIKLLCIEYDELVSAYNMKLMNPPWRGAIGRLMGYKILKKCGSEKLDFLKVN